MPQSKTRKNTEKIYPILIFSVSKTTNTLSDQRYMAVPVIIIFLFLLRQAEFLKIFTGTCLVFLLAIIFLFLFRTLNHWIFYPPTFFYTIRFSKNYRCCESDCIHNKDINLCNYANIVLPSRPKVDRFFHNSFMEVKSKLEII